MYLYFQCFPAPLTSITASCRFLRDCRAIAATPCQWRDYGFSSKFCFFFIINIGLKLLVPDCAILWKIPKITCGKIITVNMSSWNTKNLASIRDTFFQTRNVTELFQLKTSKIINFWRKWNYEINHKNIQNRKIILIQHNLRKVDMLENPTVNLYLLK